MRQRLINQPGVHQCLGPHELPMFSTILELDLSGPVQDGSLAKPLVLIGTLEQSFPIVPI